MYAIDSGSVAVVVPDSGRKLRTVSYDAYPAETMASLSADDGSPDERERARRRAQDARMKTVYGVTAAVERDVEVRDRLRQALAQLSLSPIADEFPTRIVVSKDGAVERAASRVIENMLTHITDDGLVPRNELLPPYSPARARLLKRLTSRRRRGSRVTASQPSSSSSGGDGMPGTLVRQDELSDDGGASALTLLRLNPRPLSEGTAQGVVYKAEVLPSPTVHYTEVADAVYGEVKRVAAVVKKSPIVRPSDWLALRSLQDAMDILREVSARYQVALSDPLLESARASALQRLLDWGWPEDEAMRMANSSDLLAREIKALQKSIDDQQSDPANEAFVDAAISFGGSLLHESGIANGFNYLYASFRAWDAAYFDTPAFSQLAREALRGTPFPVSVMVSQFLDGDLESLYRADWFLKEDGSGAIDVERAASLFQQQQHTLAAAWEAFHYSNQDLHAGNVMYSKVEKDHHIYNHYRTPTAEVWTAVPTLGVEYSIIDNGRASATFGGVKVGSGLQKRVWADQGEWDESNPSADMLRLVTLFLYTHRAQMNKLASEVENGVYAGPHPQLATDLVEFCLHVTTCADGTNVMKRISACATEECRRIERDFTPYAKGSQCHQAVPKDNLWRFARHYVVDPATIPKDAVVYTLAFHDDVRLL
jgi:hypothetical protein